MKLLRFIPLQRRPYHISLSFHSHHCPVPLERRYHSDFGDKFEIGKRRTTADCFFSQILVGVKFVHVPDRNEVQGPKGMVFEHCYCCGVDQVLEFIQTLNFIVCLQAFIYQYFYSNLILVPGN